MMIFHLTGCEISRAFVRSTSFGDDGSTFPEKMSCSSLVAVTRVHKHQESMSASQGGSGIMPVVTNISLRGVRLTCVYRSALTFHLGPFSWSLCSLPNGALQNQAGSSRPL